MNRTLSTVILSDVVVKPIVTLRDMAEGLSGFSWPAPGLPPANMPFHAWLVAARRDRPWATVSWLARVVDVERQTVHNWIKGKSPPELPHAVAVTILVAISEREQLIDDPRDLRLEARVERRLNARLAQIERHLPVDGQASPLWDEYMQTVLVLTRLRAAGSGSP